LSSDTDGVYATVGPVASAVRVADDWFSGYGLELSVVRVREQQFPVAIGLAGGGISYAGRAGGRLWLEAETAVEKPLPFGLGLGLGAAAEIDPVRPPRLGVEATLWAFVGIVPYVRVGALQETGAFVELGVMIKIPAHRF
jgi:hypothetical protein